MKMQKICLLSEIKALKTWWQTSFLHFHVFIVVVVVVVVDVFACLSFCVFCLFVCTPVFLSE